MAIAKAGKIWQIAKRWQVRDSLSAVFRATIGTLSSIAAGQTVANSPPLSVFDTRRMVQGLLSAGGECRGTLYTFYPISHLIQPLGSRLGGYPLICFILWP